MERRNVRLLVQYDGTDYSGFQIQPDRPTIQGELERAIEQVTKERARVTGSGRTDAGVHALGQVVNFPTAGTIPTEKFPVALNSVLPQAISVIAADEAPEGFHARRDAKGKVYRYRILNRERRSPLMARYTWHVPRWLSTQWMRRGARDLVGEHDFSSFCAAGSEVRGRVRQLRRCEVVRHGEMVETTLEADGFLYMMVRNIVGSLVQVGQGLRGAEEMPGILAAQDRGAAGPTAPPQGLTLICVQY